MAYTFKHGDRPLDDYTIQRAIGRGGFGEVYYAISDGGREVALKYLKENPHVELRGVSHCINLKSPHLVSIFDVKKSAEDEYFIVMEYCSGPSLRDLLIAEPKGFSPEKAAFFTREIAKGLAYLHDRGIVHRDLKPGNIFFDDGYVKIGDYGLSKFISVSRHSAQTASVGTVHYMAPEIGSGNYSKGVDIYALGVILYEMLLGKVPFEGSSMAEVLMKHLMSQPELNDLPQPFGRVIHKALEKDPKDRYQSVEEMTDELLSGDDIQKSLAGFSAKSLEGAVRVGGRDRLDSPRPSPNPVYGPRVAPLAKPIAPLSPGSGMPLPDKVARRMERIARKIDDQVGRLNVKRGLPVGIPSRPPAAAGLAGIPYAQPLPASGEGARRFALMVLLTLGLSVGFGLLVGNAASKEEVGISAGLLVVAMLGSVALGRKASQWFKVDDGPMWAQRLVRACCAAPLLALPSIPLFEAGVGIPPWIGLIVVAVFADWAKSFEANDDGEISFGRIFSTGLGAFVATAVAVGIFHRKGPEEEIMFLAAGVAAIASFIVQAGASWSAYQNRGKLRQPPVPPAGPESPPSQEKPAALDLSARESLNPQLAAMQAAMQAAMHGARTPGPSDAPSGRSVHSLTARPRSMLVRMFWSLVAFVLMGGMIVMFLTVLLGSTLNYDDITASIIACVACGTFMIFALRKTTPFKRIGFWRDTVRPFALSCLMFAIGGTITGISREWNRCLEYSEYCPDEIPDVNAVAADIVRFEAEGARIAAEAARQIHVPRPPNAPSMLGSQFIYSYQPDSHCVQWALNDDGRIGLISGLVMSSIGLVLLTLFTGRKPPPADPQAFLRESQPDPMPA